MFSLRPCRPTLLAQCEGLREGLAGDPPPRPEPEMIPRAEALIRATCADFRVGGGEAYYSSERDYVAVPSRAAFADANDFYDTAYHELSHWSGHPTRLARDTLRDYHKTIASRAREEMVAEISASFVGAVLGLVPTVRHADYAGYWLDILRADNRAIFRAANQASKAADYILAFEDAGAVAEQGGRAAA